MTKKLTKEEVNAELAAQGRGIILIGEYTNTATKTLFKGACGHEWEATPNHIKKGRGCPYCAGQRQTKETVNLSLAPRQLKMIGEFKGMKTKTLFVNALCGHEWEARPQSIVGGGGCPYCAGQAGITTVSVNKELAKKGIILLGEYKSMNTKTQFKGECGHVWSTRLNNIRNQGQGCPHCAGNAPLIKEEINARLKTRRIILISEYQGVNVKALFTGACGHEWHALPSSVLSGNNCPECSKTAKLTKKTINERLEARGIVLTGAYKNTTIKAEFVGACGHKWQTRPHSVLGGTGCPHCAERGGWSNPVSYVYALAYSNGFVKIGIATDPYRRIYELQRATREHIELIALYQFGDGTGRAAYEAEQAAHKHFTDQHAGLKGFAGATELFRITPAEACEYLRQAGGRVAELELEQAQPA